MVSAVSGLGPVPGPVTCFGLPASVRQQVADLGEQAQFGVLGLLDLAAFAQPVVRQDDQEVDDRRDEHEVDGRRQHGIEVEELVGLPPR